MNEKTLHLLNPDIFKTSLQFSSLFIAYFENTTDYIIDQPRSFFTIGSNSEKGDLISPDYKTKVLSLDKKPINASLKWFQINEAISTSDIEIFDDLRRYRNKLSHELTKILLDEGLDVKVYSENLDKLFTLRIKLEKWWFFWFEIELMEIENLEQLKESEVTTGGQIIYQLFLDLLSDDKDRANYYVTELRRRMTK